MSDTVTPKKKKRRPGGCLKTISFCFLMMLGVVLVWVAFNLRFFPEPGQPVLPVSKELTVLTEPLDDNGDVDYLEALNEKYSAGVTTEGNAMVKLAEALGPRPKMPELNAEFCRRLGIPDLPEQPAIGNYFKPINQWRFDTLKNIEEESTQMAPEFGMGSIEDMEQIEEQVAQKTYEELGIKTPESLEESLDEPLDEKAFMMTRNAEDLSIQVDFAGAYPWTPEQLPSVGKWLQYNERAIKTVEEGLSRPDYYHPMVSFRQPKVMNASLAFPGEYRELSRYFSVRAMMNLHLGNVEKTLADVDSMFRLAELTARGRTIVEELIGIAIAGKARQVAMQVAINQNTTAAQLVQLQQQLANLKPVGGVANRVDEVERYMGLEVIAVAGRGQIARAFSQDGNASTMLTSLSSTVDFEESTRVLNGKYDMCVEFLRSSNNAEQRKAAMEEFETQMKQMEIELVDPWEIVKTVAAGRKAKGNWVGRFHAGILLPAIGAVQSAETRTESRLEAAKLYVAVCRFKKENGQLPESLDEVTPRYIDALPMDPFTDGPFVYGKTEDGFRIHSALWPPVGEYDQQPVYDDQRANAEYLLQPQKMTWIEFLESKIPGN